MDKKILINSSSPSTPTAPPPLLSLSNELLDTIFTLAHDDKAKDFAQGISICRRLLPLQRAPPYRRVEIHRYKALKSFHGTVLGSNTCAKLVRHLDFKAWDYNAVEADGGAWRRRSGQSGDADLRKVMTPVDLRHSYLSLKLDELDPALVDVLFLDQEASRALKLLKTLDFSVHDVPLIPDDCDAGDWRLVLKPGLTSYQTSWKGAALDQTAPNLVELELVDFSLDWFSSALATAPVGLRILSLVNDMDVMPGEPPTQVPVNDVLARFKNLEQLRLGHGALDMSEPSSGLEALVTVDTLIHLSFDDTDLLTDSFLLALLSNLNHLPNLATLELNHIYSVQSYTFEEMQGALPSFVERQHHPHWPMWGEWHAPSYPPGCTEAGLRDVVRAAHARGIVVEGTAYDALEWRDAFDAEQRAALLALGDLTGDYARARPVLGNEVVNAHILERARASVEGVEGGGVRGGRRDEVGEDLEE